MPCYGCKDAQHIKKFGKESATESLPIRKNVRPRPEHPVIMNSTTAVDIDFHGAEQLLNAHSEDDLNVSQSTKQVPRIIAITLPTKAVHKHATDILCNSCIVM